MRAALLERIAAAADRGEAPLPRAAELVRTTFDVDRVSVARIDAAAGTRAVVVDLTGTTFVDSSMLKELLRANAELTRSGSRLIVCGISPPVRRLFDLTRTKGLFTLADDLAAALRIAG
jgi:anti-anti-sigma factor